MDSISSSPYPLKPLKTVGSSSSSFSPRHLDDGKNQRKRGERSGFFFFFLFFLRRGEEREDGLFSFCVFFWDGESEEREK